MQWIFLVVGVAHDPFDVAGMRPPASEGGRIVKVGPPASACSEVTGPVLAVIRPSVGPRTQALAETSARQMTVVPQAA
jgi:hypothetical protein